MNSSYPNDVLTEDTFHSSFKVPKKPCRSKTGLIASNSKQKLPKPQLTDLITESPYAQVQTISKNRSISNTRIKPAMKQSSTPLNSNNSYLLISKNKTQSTINPHPSDSSGFRPKFLSHTVSSSKNSSKAIEDKLIGTLKKLKDKQSATNRFEAYQNAFVEIIERDEVYGGLLKRIKEAYEQRIRYEKIDVSKDVVEKLKEEIRELREKVLSCKQEKKYLVKKIEKVAKENVEISRLLEDREERYMDLQDKLMKLSKVDLTDLPNDEDSWKYLVSENQHLLKVCEEMRKDIKHLSRKEKKLVKLVVALKNRGYPVEDVYQEDVHKEKKQKILNCDEPVIDDSENEDLISGRPKDVKRPEMIPKLNLDELQESQEDSSESSSTSESEEQ